MIRFAAVVLFSIVNASAFAQSFNPDAYLGANPDVRAAGMTAYQHINLIGTDELKIRLAATKALEAKANAINEVKIMFCSCSVFTESATVQDSLSWNLALTTGKTTVKALILEGWRIQSTFNITTTQFYFVFVR